MITDSVRGQTTTVDLKKLDATLGYTPIVYITCLVSDLVFTDSGPYVMDGTFYDIQAGASKYKVCPTQFSKSRAYFGKDPIAADDKPIKTEGAFEGNWDETGKKIAQVFFANLVEGAVVYVNEEECRLTKKENGAIDFIMI